LYAISYAFDNVQSVKQRVIAINLAREGMEWVYQIRDTNRLFWPAKKDECRLDMNPLVNDTNWCWEDDWMWSGNYILQKMTSGNQQSFYLSWWSDWNILDLSDWAAADDNKFALCLSAWGLREACPWHNWPVMYFRQIHGEWVFYKDSNTTGWDYLDCPKWNDSAYPTTIPWSISCSWADAKEYRFCSKVAYIGQWWWEVELCWLITNFWK
jgi:hypothetical protein